MTIADLKKGEKAIIKDIDLQQLPVKLLELGCLPESVVKLIGKAPLGDPLYLDINGTYIAIRKEIAQHIEIEKI